MSPTDENLLEAAYKRAAILNASAAWGTDPDGLLLQLLCERLEEVLREQEMKR